MNVCFHFLPSLPVKMSINKYIDEKFVLNRF